MRVLGLPKEIDGTLDAVADGLVQGWARNRLHPELTLEIEVLVDGEIIARAICDQFRDDLAIAGIGNGRYGFTVPLPDDFADGETHTISVRAAGTDLELRGSPMPMRIGPPAAAGARPQAFATDTVLERVGSLDDLRRAVLVQRRLAVFATFRRSGPAADHVLAYLRSLRKLGFATVVVDASPVGSASDWSGVEMVLRRSNVGWDFASWLAGLDAARDVTNDAEELLLANDSVFGPLFALEESFASERVRDADFWGITDSWETRYHLQSYFLLLRRQVVQSDTFWRFLAEYPFPVGKRQIVHHGEMGITAALIEAGFRPAATCPYEAVARRWLDELPDRIAAIRALPENAFLDLDALETALRGHSAARSLRHVLGTAQLIRQGLAVNGSHFFWDTLIRSFRCPFLKKDFVLANPAEIPFATDLRAVLAESSAYPVELIVEAARRSLGPRVVTL